MRVRKRISASLPRRLRSFCISAGVAMPGMTVSEVAGELGCVVVLGWVEEFE